MEFKVNETAYKPPYIVTGLVTEGGSYLKKLTVNYSKAPNSEGVVAVKKTSLKTKLLEKLFGTSTQVVILIPGKTCGSVTVNNCDEGGKDDVKI